MTTNALPEPNFIDRDPTAITTELIAQFEALTGRVLQPAQVERVLIDLIAYREGILREGIQDAAKQNLVRYARYPMLDYLGELVGVLRLGEQPARTTLRFTLTAAQALNVVVPAGTRVESKDGLVVFATETALTILAGQTSGDVTGVAQTAGVAGNGYLAAEIATLLDPIAYVAGASNISTSTGGSDQELDDPFRERILLAPESYSTGGSGAAYRYHALTAHPSIIDVAIESSAPGQVDVYPLTNEGAPSQEILDLVEATLSADKVRPISDLVVVQAPNQVDFAIVGDLTVFADADAASVQAEVEAQLEAFTETLRNKLGKDIVPSQLVGVAMKVVGAYRFELTEPAYQLLGGNAWANCTGITVNLVGVENG